MTGAPGARALLDGIGRRVEACTRCPRLVRWRGEVAARPPARFAGQEYWARPVPGFGDPGARIYVLGLATAAHGGNRTGRAFTGNPTGDWVVRALHRAGLADRPTSEHRGDGLRLTGVWTGSAVRCAPPGNRPTPVERDTCSRFLSEEVAALGDLRVLVALGGFAWDAAARWAGARPRPRFGHGAEYRPDAGPVLLGCYHPSRQNTNTGVLTEAMLDAVLARALDIARATPDRRAPLRGR
ncbi:uracil-DNA glycosylase [Actinosynnema sp. NPDC059797]